MISSTANGEQTTFEGVYGTYQITERDAKEVQRYRFCLLICAISFTAAMGQWALLGPRHAGLWLLPMATSLGLALSWIHIYLRSLHRALQILWGLGCFGLLVWMWRSGSEPMLQVAAQQPLWIWPIGPLFAALTGVGFKEFFCFRRPEAIGLTLLLPLGLLGHLSGLLSEALTGTVMTLAALLMLVLALRKFGGPVAADVGDKSVFAYLEAQRMASSA
ncbi:MAG: hypothetical protein RLZZ216_1916 [Cyanobacteriota bacterium]|jgi:uncharacterized integral membrane protein